MHRSGTSALARVLSLCGATLPKHPMAGSDINPKGFFESDPVYRLHEEILASAGSSWDDISPIPESWFASAIAAKYADQMADVVRDEFGDSPFFVLKDPRVCRLVPFWRAVLERVGVEPRFVLTARNPLEVSASLLEAQGVDPQRGLLLWLQHFLIAERDSRGQKRTLVSYDELLTDWRAVIARASRELGVAFPRMSAKAAAETDDFLSEALRHHTVSPSRLAVREDIAEWVKTTYAWAQAGAVGKRKSAKPLDRIADAFFAATSVFAPVVAASEHALERERRSASELHDELEQERELAQQLKESLELTSERESNLQNSIEVVRGDRAGLEERISTYQLQVRDLVECIKVMLVWIASSTSGAGAAGDRLETLLHTLDDQKADSIPKIAMSGLAQYRESVEIAQAAQAVAERDRRIADVEAIAAARESELQGLQAELGEIRERLIAADQRAAEADSKLTVGVSKLQEQLAVRDDDVLRLGAQLEELRGKLRIRDREEQARVEMAREVERTRRQLVEGESAISQLREQLAASESAREADREEAREVARAAALESERRAALESAHEVEREAARVAALAAVNEARQEAERQAARQAERQAARQAERRAAREAELEAALALVREDAEREQRNQSEKIAAVTAQLEAANGEIQRLHGMLSSLESARATERQEVVEVVEVVEQIPAAPKMKLARRLLDPVYWAFTFQFRARMRERRVVERLRESGLVDVRYYRRSYRDIDDEIDPVAHYVRHGAAEGRNPNDRFDTEFYLATNPDVVRGTVNPLDHFNSHGWRERRNPHPQFAVSSYLDANPDVLESGMNPLQHFLSHGRRERRPTATPAAQSGHAKPAVEAIGSERSRH